MAVLDDITLLRYSEDDLSKQEKREVEELLALNPDAQKKLEMLIRSSKVLESALGHLKDAKPPESIGLIWLADGHAFGNGTGSAEFGPPKAAPRNGAP